MANVFTRIFSQIRKNAQLTHEDYNKAIFKYLGDSVVFNPENDYTYINDGYRKNSTVYSLINIITKAATTVPYHIYRKVNEHDLKRYKSITSGTMNNFAIHKASMLQKHALEEVEHTALHELLDRPNPAQSFNTFLTEVVAFGKLTGNRYIYGIAPDTGQDAGKYKELYVLPSQVVEIKAGGLMKPVESYRITYNGDHVIPAEAVLHIKDFSPYMDGTGSHLYGQSPLRAGLRTLTTNNEAVLTGVKYLQNQSARGVLMSDEGDLNEVQAQQLKDKFRQNYQSSRNAGDIVITPKKLSWVNFGLNASDLSLIEQYNASIKDLCNIYNVPVQLLNNTESATYNNMAEAKKALYQNCVIPELVKIRDEINRWLVPKFGADLFFDFDFTAIAELQEETENIVNQISQSWWLTPNEKRQAMSYGVDEENPALNDYYIPANLIPLTTTNIESMDDELPEPEDDIDDEMVKRFLAKAAVRGMMDVFTTIEEAQSRAEELGGSGYHELEIGEETGYMPFETHDEYEEAIENQKEYAFDYDKDYHDDEDEKSSHISARLQQALRNKVKDHNEKVGDNASKRTNSRTLLAVYRRGIGAYRTNPQSVRPSVSSPEQWAMARINSFLFALRNGKFRSGKHDQDLLPEDHPMSTKKNEKANHVYNSYPQTATNNAKRMLEWKSKYNLSAGTNTGWRHARMLENREPLTIERLRRFHSFFSRHDGNQKINPDFKDEPWRDNGYVMWNAWGGDAMQRYVSREIDKLEDA